MDGTDIKKAVRKHEQLSETTPAENFVELHLTKKGTSKFAAATKAAANAHPDNNGNPRNYIAILLDDQVISTPYVDASYATTGINSDTVVISGDFTAEQAEELASIISAGQLPFDLRTTSKTVVASE